MSSGEAWWNKPLPSDRVVEIWANAGNYAYGVGTYRASIVKVKRSWIWRVWDVLHPSLGGEGTIDSGRAKTQMQAMECLDILRRKAGIDERLMGGA